MIRVYFLPVETIDGTEQVAGIQFIHDALLDATREPNERKLTMDTTDEEHNQLSALAASWKYPSFEEIDRYDALVIIYQPDPDTLRAQELLTSSPDVITQPEMWELVRIFGRRLGYHF